MKTGIVREIGWKHLRGRKTSHRLHRRMFSDEGSVKLLETRPVPYSDKNPHGVYAVRFDREYAIQKMAYEIEECSQVPFLDLVELLAEAYTIVNPDAPIVGISLICLR